MRLSLTDLAIHHLAFEKQTRVYDTQLPGFGILVSKTVKTFFVVTGKDRRFTTLGRYPDVSLKTARRDAKRVQTTETTEKGVNAFPEALQAFTEATRPHVKPATLAQYLSYLSQMDVRLDMTYEEIETVLARWKHAPSAQNYAYAALRTFLNFCLERGYIAKSPLFRKRPPNKTRSRDRVLSDDELARVWRATGNDTYGRIVRLLILTGQRREEVRNLAPEDVASVITFHTKGDGTNILPITPMMKEQLVLPFQFNNWSSAKARLDREVMVDFTHHDLRRTFASTLARLGVDVWTIERLLGHSIGKVQQTYQRYSFMKEKTEALLTWEAHIVRITSPGMQPRATCGSYPTELRDEDTQQEGAASQDFTEYSAHHSSGKGVAASVPEKASTHTEPGGLAGKRSG